MYSIIVQRLKQRMEELGINARTLTARSDVGQSFVYDVLSGKSKNPTSSKLKAIATELGVSLAYLVGEEQHNFDNQNYALCYSLLDNNAIPRLSLSRSYFSGVKDDNKLYTYSILDDGMKPIFLKHDVVVLSVCTTKTIPNGIFAIEYKQDVMVRTLENIEGTNRVKVIAENSNFESYEEYISQINIMGQVQYLIRGV